MSRAPVAALFALACSSSVEGLDPGPYVPPCEEQRAELIVEGRVVDAQGRAVAHAAVWLEERAWEGVVYGRAVADAVGSFSFPVDGLPLVEGRCLELARVTGPRHVVSATAGQGAAEVDVSEVLLAAWLDGDEVADLPALTLR